MDSVKTTTVSDARDFFLKELYALVEKHGLKAELPAIQYLADLLIRNISSEQFFSRDAEGNLKQDTLAELYLEFMQGSPEKQKAALKRLGDLCMLVTGFFSPSLTRKAVDLDYYFGMGGGAYWQLANLPSSKDASTYLELSQKFKPFSDLLGEFSERSGIQNNSDLLRTYERWLFTGNERLKNLLSTHGIAPLSINHKVKH